MYISPQLKPGTLLQPVVKAQGLKKGEHIKKIGAPIRVVSVEREPLGKLLHVYKHGQAEVCCEGFPEMSPGEFVVFFARSHGLAPRRGVFSDKIARAINRTVVTRIEFTYDLSVTNSTQGRDAGQHRRRVPLLGRRVVPSVGDSGQQKRVT